jgi:pimeloyl-ACP methyl ester carboxylesterase
MRLLFLIYTFALHLTAQMNTLVTDAPPAKDAFVTANGVRLHYVDWGGQGQVLLFLTPEGGTAHTFDSLAPRFTDRFRVLGLTRRGQGQSDRPASGYDPATLAADLRAFLDAMNIERAILAGYSIAGDEQTKFAVLYPQRVTKLVYLDAAYDRAAGKELMDRLRRIAPLPPPRFTDHPTAELLTTSAAYRPEYSQLTAPALSFFVIADPPIPRDLDPSVVEQFASVWTESWRDSFERQRRRFVREVKVNRTVELRGTTHQRFLFDSRQAAIVVREMRDFLLNE